MLVVDEVAEGKLSMEERFDITQTHFEYQGEHDNYVAAFNGAMSIPDMQEYSLVYSENTPASGRDGQGLWDVQSLRSVQGWAENY